MNEENRDFFATEMLAELKAANERAYEQLKVEKKHQVRERIAYMITLVAVIAGFLLYLYQYDFVSYETHNAEGVYALVDSEGNVVAADLTDEQLAELMEGSYGESDAGEGTSTNTESITND